MWPTWVSLAGSRFNSKAEANYSPTEDALHKAKYFILSCQDLTVGMDHKPLLGILNDKSLEAIDNPKILRLKEKTLVWRFKIVHSRVALVLDHLLST